MSKYFQTKLYQKHESSPLKRKTDGVMRTATFLRYLKQISCIPSQGETLTYVIQGQIQRSLQCKLYSLGPLMSTFRSPLPAFLVSTLKSPTCFTLSPDGWRPRPVALQAPGMQAVREPETAHVIRLRLIHLNGLSDVKGVGCNQLTGSHVHIEWAPRDSHPSEGDRDDVRSGLCGPVGAAVRAVTRILNHDLHTVLPALRVSYHGRHVARACTYVKKNKLLMTSLPQVVN